MTTAPTDTPAKILMAKLVGLVAAFGLTALGMAGFMAIQAGFDRRDAAVLASIPEVLMSWSEPLEADVWALVLVVAPPLVLIPGAFGGRWRWRMVGLAAALVAGGLVLKAAVGRPELFVATPLGASWLSDGRPREHWSWGAATAVGVGCVEDPKPAVNYDVSFPSGREASLAREGDDIRRLAARLAPIDASLRARAAPRFAAAAPACLDRVGQGLSAAERTGLRALFSR